MVERAVRILRAGLFACLMISAATIAARGASSSGITLLLGQPEYSECGGVSVNGYVGTTSGEIRYMRWDWGDGQTERSWFPARHEYLQNGACEVRVTAHASTGEDLTKSVLVTVANAEDPGCTHVPQYYALRPYNLHLSLEGSPTGQLEVLDSTGSYITEGLSFYGYDSSLIQVSPNGLVTALRPEGPGEIGTWVSVSVDGRPALNTCVTRVLSVDYGVPFSMFSGVKTTLYVPDRLGDEDIWALVRKYQITLANDYVYINQDSLVGCGFVPGPGDIVRNPYPGQAFEVDFGEGEQSRVCGISGNPIRLGWNITGNDWQNCFLVPFTPPRSPQWFIFYHEMGHNNLATSGTFGGTLGPVFSYSEGVATFIGLSGMRRVLDSPAAYPLGEDATQTLDEDYWRKAGEYGSDFSTWIASGAPFAALDPDLADGILLHHEAEDPSCFAARFFRALRPENQDALQPVADGATSEGRMHTFFAALCSYAAGRDLRQTFESVYHYPLDGDYYDRAYSCLNGLSSPPPATLTAPADGETGVPTKVTLRWTRSPGAVDYGVYLGKAEPLTLVAPHAIDPEYLAERLSPETTYLWRVVSRDPCAGDRTSATGHFTTRDRSRPGDCNLNGTISIGEVAGSINMYLGIKPTDCDVDCNGDGKVSISEVQRVISGFLGMGVSC